MLKTRFNGKMLASLILLMMTICVSAFAGLRDEVWTVNPSDFRYDMSLYFRMENKDFEDLSSFEIGAFVDDECRGLAEKLELPDGEICLYMRIRSNKAGDEKLSFYMKDKKTGQVVLVKGEDGTELTFKADTRIGLPSQPFMMTPFYTAVFKIDGEVVKTLEVGYGDPIEAPVAPEKEGYTFNGWGDLPATMPAYDIEMHSSYTVNTYSLTFKIGDEEIYSGELAYGASIIAPEAPAKEGYQFVSWGDVPETMPASDLTFTGSYEVLLYNVVYKIDGETVYTSQIAFGQPIPAYGNVPSKEGYSFSGWTEIPEIMPAHDIEINGSYAINHYTVTFSIGNEIFVSQELAYNEEIIVPEAPAKEGYSFSGWGNVPAAMPAGNLEFFGDYTINTYTVVFRIDQEVFQSVELAYGDEIIAPEAPDMEGHTFSGWGEVPATMPAHDLVFVGTYADNYYTITFRIGDEIIKMADLAYGSEIIIPSVPEKEGYTFSGWDNVPATMPASNIELNGHYTVNNYLVSFRIDDEAIYSAELPYGSDITAPDAPEKEGYSFSGWGIVPATVPASDLVISGTYMLNTYTLSFLIDGEVYYTTQVPYGSEISLPELPAKEGYSLVGWDKVPASMPAYDLNIDGTYSVNSYALNFKIGDEVIFSGVLPYGSEIIAPEAPAKEGYSFSGWGMVPAVMPAYDLELTGSYEVNIYNLSFVVDDEVVYTTTLAYGSEIIAPFLPEVEGNTFSGWGEMPSTMPANDLVVKGTYAPNYYLLVFKIGEEVISTGEVAYGAQISVPEAPAKEGYSFSGWGAVPATMPARNLEFEGSYDPISYSLVFKIGDEVVYEGMIPYGAEVVAPEVADKEGFTFSGWGVVPSVMPAQDLVISGSYEINSYAIIFKVGDEVIYSAQLPYGSEIAVPEVPAREGYAFSGWSGVPATMPAQDLEISGSYVVNTYNIVFKIGNEVIFETTLAFGSEIAIPQAPEKEGYTFTGWGVVPLTMPAADLEFSGAYDVNYYNVTFMIADEVIYSAQLPYGAAIVAPQVPEDYEDSFMGWDEYPSTVPAHDVMVKGNVSDVSAVSSVVGSGDSFTVVTLDGIVVIKNGNASEVKERLTPGLYIINGKKVMVKPTR